MNLSSLKQVVCEQVGIPWDKLYFAVPDIHGRSDIARKVVSVLESLNTGNVVFLGDLIDKREDPFGVIWSVFEAQERNPSWKVVLGNHEDIALNEYLTGISSGQNNSIFNLCTNQQVDFCIKYFSTLPLYIEVEHLIFCHGGIWNSYNKKFGDISKEEIIWTYGVHPKYSGKKIVRGHDIYSSPIEEKNNIATQTAAWLDESPFCISIIRDTADTKKLLGWIQVDLYIEPILIWNIGVQY